MGLAGPRKRAKLSHDPNNTSWSRDTTSFGHKILSSQGWAPGQFLGAKDANHASHYTHANASHIRVLLKDDNLGLGARLGGERAETFGLNQFSGLLGRLNGKSEIVLKKEESKHRDVNLALYQGRKWGNMNFVSAGFLVGDKIASKAEAMKGAPTFVGTAEQGAEGSADTQDSKKRKRGTQEEARNVESKGDTPIVAHDADKDPEEPTKETKQQRRERKEREKAEKKARKTVKKERKARSANTSGEEGSGTDSASRRKAEKKARKEERRKRREERRTNRRSESASSTPIEDTSSTSSGTSTPTNGTSAVASRASASLLGRHAVRQRYILQKRRVGMDPQALKEVCVCALKFIYWLTMSRSSCSRLVPEELGLVFALSYTFMNQDTLFPDAQRQYHILCSFDTCLSALQRNSMSFGMCLADCDLTVRH